MDSLSIHGYTSQALKYRLCPKVAYVQEITVSPSASFQHAYPPLNFPSLARNIMRYISLTTPPQQLTLKLFQFWVRSADTPHPICLPRYIS